MESHEAATDSYLAALEDYLNSKSEHALFQASLLSQYFVESGLGPDDIIALHFEGLESILPQLSPRSQPHAVGNAHQFLLDVMITYGVKYKEYLELKLYESIREAEARAQFEQERAMEAERIEQEKSEILASIAHELGTPLTAARGHLELAMRAIRSGRTEALSPLLGSTQEALDRLTRMTADLVQVSRGEPIDLDREPLQLSTILTKACDWAQPSARANGVDLFLDGDPPNIQIIANEGALLSIVGNLLSNAIRYTPAGGSVAVRCECDEREVWVDVKDSGMGMPPEVQQRIFDKFYRSPDARRANSQGLGLGLTLVQQFVTSHNGRLELESVPGDGSRFRVIFPIEES
ncbi:MAG: ATP-binding protein [Nitrolancea sp.]